MGRDPPITITIVFLVEKSKNEMTRNDTKRSLKQRGEEGRGRGRGRVREKRKKLAYLLLQNIKKKKRKKEERQHCGSFHRARTFTEAKEKEVTTNVVVEAC